VVTVAGTFAAWILAGRFLRPIRLISDRARVASGDDLSVRVSLDGPDDEVKDLADTFDAMLDRIEGSFEAQRRFSAQVAHELRTPLSVSRTEVEMLLDDLPDPGVRIRLTNVAEATRRAERLVSQLHVLSRTERGDLAHDPFALDELVGNVVGRVVEQPAWQTVHLDLELRPAAVLGDRTLLESLVRNLVDNAGRHNRPGGRARVAVRSSDDGRWSELVVANSVRDDGTPVDPSSRAHVGLTIVDAVVRAHDGTVGWHTSPGEVTAVVRLPAPDPGTAVGRSDALTTA
jgi:signal transduction histidine kinase